MSTIEINGKEHALSVNYEGVKYLNRIVEAGAQDLYAHAILSGLNHTGESYTLADVKQAIEQLDLHDVKRMSDEITNASRYYNLVVAMMLHENTRRMKKRGTFG